MTEIFQRSAPIIHDNYRITENDYSTKVQKIVDDTVGKIGLTVDEISNIAFDPEKHLLYYSGGDFMKHKYDSTRRLSMEELGLLSKFQISDIGVLDPFPLFTDEAILMMKYEILSKELFMKHASYVRSAGAGLDCKIRGFVDGSTKCSFIESAWNHPKTVELILKMAGVELEVIFDYEIAHTNITLSPDGDVNEEIKKARDMATSGATKGEDMPSIVDWHYDSYPFVCVLMVSDTLEMIGGETSLRMGASDDGTQKVAMVPGPQMGYANVLQGRYIEHIAPKPVGGKERITMVTSYKAKDPSKHDGTVLNTVKPEINSGSVGNVFYPQYVDYRLDLLSKRFEVLKSSMLDEEGNFNKEETIAKLKEFSEYINKTWSSMELTEEEKLEYTKIKAFKVDE